MCELIVTVSLDAQAPVPDRLDESTLTSLSRYVLDREGTAGPWTLSFRFTTDEEIQRLHQQFMGLDSPTDIMTFPYEDMNDAVIGEPELPGHGGDIVISVDRAAMQAKDVGWSLVEELLFLSIHGMLHLLGWDDRDGPERTAMLERQADLLHHWNATQAVDPSLASVIPTGAGSP